MAVAVIPAVIGLPGALFAQVPTPSAVRNLPAPEWRSEAYFTDIASAVRLRSGDVVVADPGGRELVLVTGAGARRRVIGREGDGPGEYRAPQMVFGIAGDSVALFDSRSLRVSVYDATGAFARSVSAGGMGGAVAPLVGDGRHRLAFRSFGMERPTTTSTIFTFSVRSGGFETVARIAGPRVVQDGGGKGIGQRSLRFLPYAEVDGFVPLPNGGHLIARAQTNTVEWYDRRGTMLGSARFPGTRVAVTDSMRRLAGSPQLQQLLPASLPAFDDFGMVRSDAGRVWIRASQMRGGASTWYGFAPGESVPRAISLPRGSRLVGASEPFLLVAVRDEDGLQRLEAYRIPGDVGSTTTHRDAGSMR